MFCGALVTQDALWKARFLETINLEDAADHVPHLQSSREDFPLQFIKYLTPELYDLKIFIHILWKQYFAEQPLENKFLEFK